MSIEDIKQIMDAFDPAALLPDLSSLPGIIELVCRVTVLAGPIVLLVMGLLYLLLSPKEANYYFGYRCYFGMGSQEAWRFTQRIAGLVWTLLGLILTIVMVIQTNGFRELAIMDQIGKAIKCLLWEAGLIAVSCLGINITAMIFFDRKGDRRLQKKKAE